MFIRVIFAICIVCVGCQSGKIACPEQKFAKLRTSNPGKKSFFNPAAPSKVYATTKTVPSENKRKVDLERLKASRVTGKEMLEQYGSVEEWDCPSPNGKKRYSKVTKENIKRNEKKLREYQKNHGPDSTSLIVPR
jgi:hypothetical protein